MTENTKNDAELKALEAIRANNARMALDLANMEARFHEDAATLKERHTALVARIENALASEQFPNIRASLEGSLVAVKRYTDLRDAATAVVNGANPQANEVNGKVYRYLVPRPLFEALRAALKA